jgi:glycerol uptake facilitator-like aquaporin
MKKLVAELVGTFILVMGVALTGNPLAIGLALASAIFMFGHISGAHFNPAVTLAVFVNKGISAVEMGKYWVAQVTGAMLAAWFVRFMATGAEFTPAYDLSKMNGAYGMHPLFVTHGVEIFYTFVLASVILAVTGTKAFEGNKLYPYAIGLTLAGIAFAGGPISGGVYNPAVALGPAILNGNEFTLLVTYTVAPLVGGALAGFSHRWFNSAS